MSDCDSNMFVAGGRTSAAQNKDFINSLPLFSYAGNISLVHTEEGLIDAVTAIGQQQVIGFDTETRPTFRKGKVNKPSLVQIATDSRVFIFLLKQQPLDEALCKIFENQHIIKAGVALHDDFRALSKMVPFTVQSMLDLADVARAHGVSQFGLRGLAAHFLGIRISKGEQCSNWGKANLTQKQIIYAATDAWISLRVYRKMEELGLVSAPA